MANLNRIILIGRLMADPEGRSTMDGTPMTRFRLAVDRPQGGADFVDVVAWRQAAENAGQLRKGSMALVEGRIQVRTFEDQTGQKRWATEVVAKEARPLDKQAGGDKMPVVDLGETVPDEGGADAELESDLPF